jgi:TonB-dependent starch-binding outer membrane protein SusC
MKKIIICFLLGFLTAGGHVLAQSASIYGVVSDASSGETLPGASILVEGTSIGTMTDADGEFLLEVPAGEIRLLVRFVGYLSQTRAISLTAGQRQELNFALSPDIALLEEFVVVGYGMQRKSVVTGAIAKVEASEIEKAAPLRVEQVLQGRTAGVMVTSNSGQPGDGLTVRIRGTGTINNANPLYVVDGMPVGGIDYLNPSDIQSIEVLKDASATAIYGSRGANGVVLITTKMGESDAFSVVYDAYTGVQNAWKKVSLLDAPEYVQIWNEAYANDLRSRPFNPDLLSGIGAGTDWQDAIFYENAPVQDHNLALSGGTGRTVFHTSLSYLQQDGIVAEGKSNYERYTFRLNTRTEYGRLTFGNQLAYTNKTTRGIGTNEIFGGVLTRAQNMDPITPVQNTDGSFGISPYMSQEVVNPVAFLDILNSMWRENKLVGGIWGELRLMDGLRLRSSFSTDLAIGMNDNYAPIYNLGGNVSNQVTQATKNFNQWFTWQTEHYLSYETTVNQHSFTALAGFSALETRFEGLFGSRQGWKFPDWNFTVIDGATDVESDQTGGGAWEHALVSYFGRLNYNFQEKYMLEAVLRMDGSSNFGPANRYGFFPSVSAGWVLTREDFMQNIPAVSFWKLRAGWGQNGNESIGLYQYSSNISSITTYIFGQTPSIVDGRAPLNISNTDIRWETSEQLNFATDLTFLDNRLSLTLDYYIKTTKDWLVQAPIPSYVGLNPAFVNGGDVKNSGLEIELGFRQRSGDFRYGLNLAGAFNKNEVTRIDNAEGIIYGAGAGTAMANINVAQVGMPIGYFWGFKTDGIFQNWSDVNAHAGPGGQPIQPNAQPGDIRFLDMNGDGIINDNDRTMIGNPYPDFTMGLTYNMEYKSFDFSMFWYTAVGHQIFKVTRRYDLPNMNWQADVLNRWTGEGTSNTHPRVTLDDPNMNYSRVSDFLLESGDFLRLKDIQIGYTLPGSLTERAGIESLRIYAAAQNLLTFTDYSGHDPEVGGWSPIDYGIDRGIYPQPRTLRLGINLSL